MMDRRTHEARLNGMFLRPDVSQMSAPVQCKWCGCIHDSGPVEVIARYADCSVWRCPNCGVTLDDRPAGWGGTYPVDKKTGEVRCG